MGFPLHYIRVRSLHTHNACKIEGVFTLSNIFSSHAGMSNNGALVAIMLVLLIISTNGHYVIITKDIIRSSSDTFDVEVPHQLSIEFPLMCKHVPSNCQPFLLQFHSMLAELFMPSVDPVEHLKLINTTIGAPEVLVGVTTCFRYIPTGHGNELYTLCLKNRTDEITIVTYKIKYTEDFEIEPSPAQYGNGHGTHIDMDSPLIVTFSNSNDPVVLYIANVRGDAKLFIKELNEGGDVYDLMLLPSDCIAPYELRHLHQLDALLKCSNGFVYAYHGDTREFAKLPFQGITMLERCTNSSSSFVMVTRDGVILFNEIALQPLTFQPNAISSFTCHWNGTVTNFYFTISQDDGMIHYMSIPLEYANPVTEPHLMLKLSNREPHYSFDVTQSSIVGSAWVIKLFDSNRNMQETVLIDIDKEISNNRLSNDIAYVLSLKSVLEHDDGNDQGGFQGDGNPQTSGNSSKSPILIISILVVVVVVVVFAVAIIGSVLLLILYKRHPQRRARRQSYSTLQTGERLAENYTESETTFTSSQSGSEHETHMNTSDDPAVSNDVPTANDENHDQGNHQTTTDDSPLPTSDHDDNQSPANDQSGNINTPTPNVNRMYAYIDSTDTLIHATSESAIRVNDEIPSDSVVVDRLPMRVATTSSGPVNDSTERDSSDDETENNN